MEHLLVPFESDGLPRDAIALVLAPHPDDEVFGCGGTIALHAAGGGRASVVLLTAGDVGGDPATRLAESAAAAAELGLPPPECWQLGDREVRYGERLVERIVDAIRSHGATVLFAPSLWEVHPDHRATALAAIEALRRHGGCDLMAYEVGAPLRPSRLVDITPALDAKRRAVACFASQFGRQRYDLQVEGLNRYRTYTLPPEVQAAEAFEYVAAGRIAAQSLEFFRSEYQRQRDAGLTLAPEDMSLVTVVVRCHGDCFGLPATLDSIAAQTWGRIEVVVVGEPAVAATAPLPEWCGRFPLRRADALPDAGAGDGAVLCVDAGEAIAADTVAEAMGALERASASAIAVLLVRRDEDEARFDEAASDPTRQWRRELRLLLDPHRPAVALVRRAGLDGPALTQWIAGSRATERAVWSTWFARGALHVVERADAPLGPAGAKAPDVAPEIPLGALAALVTALPDAGLERVIAALRDGLQQPSAQAILDANQVEPGTFLDRIRIAARQAAERNAAVDLLERHGIPGGDVAGQVRCAVRAYEDWIAAQRLLLAQAALTGDGWEDRLRQACRAAEQLPALQRELDAIRASRSWTFTAPLRYLGALLRRARAG